MKIKEWYNGYNFLQDTLYNPFDIFLYLRNRDLIAIGIKQELQVF
jgi:hypothetical protein